MSNKKLNIQITSHAEKVIRERGILEEVMGILEEINLDPNMFFRNAHKNLKLKSPSGDHNLEPYVFMIDDFRLVFFLNKSNNDLMLVTAINLPEFKKSVMHE
jgi:hypothetical protein